jgi:2-(1,2-epoxy-1,2-dihydrophenyl)acetyl-CoA isomerase
VATEILYEVADKVATITLNNPEKLNPFSRTMLSEWCDAYRESQARDDVNVIVVTGAGRGFSSGGNVGTMGEKADNSPGSTKARIFGEIQWLANTLIDVDKPVIAAVNGVCTGGGMDAAIMCDIVCAAQSARFAETYSKIGLLPGAGGAWFLPRRIGRGRALKMLWTAEFLDATEAERIGLADCVFPDEGFMDEVMKLARRIADAPPMSIRYIKRTVDSGLRADLRTSLDLVSSHLAVVRSLDDHVEAIDAFKNKRKPVFKGS